MGLAVVLAAVAAVGVLSPFWAAKSMLEDFKHLDQDKEAVSAFRDFHRKHRSQLVDEECENGTCESQFLVSNWLLSKLHLAPRTELRAWVTVDHEKLDFFGLEYTSFLPEQNAPVVHVQEDFCADRRDIRCDDFALNPHGRNVTPAWNGIVEFGQLASNAQKNVARNVNLKCLFHGCSNIAAMLPSVWRSTGTGVVSSCLRSSADSLAEAAQPLDPACSER